MGEAKLTCRTTPTGAIVASLPALSPGVLYGIHDRVLVPADIPEEAAHELCADCRATPTTSTLPSGPFLAAAALGCRAGVSNERRRRSGSSPRTGASDEGAGPLSPAPCGHARCTAAKAGTRSIGVQPLASPHLVGRVVGTQALNPLRDAFAVGLKNWGRGRSGRLEEGNDMVDRANQRRRASGGGVRIHRLDAWPLPGIDPYTVKVLHANLLRNQDATGHRRRRRRPAAGPRHPRAARSPSPSRRVLMQDYTGVTGHSRPRGDARRHGRASAATLHSSTRWYRSLGHHHIRHRRLLRHPPTRSRATLSSSSGATASATIS